QAETYLIAYQFPFDAYYLNSSVSRALQFDPSIAVRPRNGRTRARLHALISCSASCTNMKNRSPSSKGGEAESKLRRLAPRDGSHHEGTARSRGRSRQKVHSR